MTLPFDELPLPVGVSTRHASTVLKKTEKIEDFEVFDFYSDNKKVSIGDDADYLRVFTTLAEKMAGSRKISEEPLLVATDSGGNRVLARFFTLAEKEEFRYAYIAFGAALKTLPENTINQAVTFFAEITCDSGAKEGFEKEAKKTLRVIPEESKSDWERVMSDGLSFIKTDLYAFHLLKLYSWGFQILKTDGKPEPDIHLVRPKPGKPRGASRK